MDDLTDTRHISRLEIVDTGRRRRWSAAEKLRIVEESFSAPRLASATAHRHGISIQLLFAWRRAYREGRLGEGAFSHFVPAMISPDQPETSAEVPRRLSGLVPRRTSQSRTSPSASIATSTTIIDAAQGFG